MSEKPRLVPLTDPDEIASVERNEYGDIVGGKFTVGPGKWQWFGYDWSIEAWRERRQTDGATEANSGE